MAAEQEDRKNRLRRYTYWFIGILALVLLVAYVNTWPFVVAQTADSIDAYEIFIRENPNDRHVEEAKKRIKQLMLGFHPKFFLIYEGKDLSREISIFNTLITDKEQEAATLAYVNAPDSDSGGCRVTVRLVNKKTGRERTIVATSTEPEWVRVAVGSGRITSSGGGSHTIDGHYHKESRNGQGLLMQDILEYAQTLESDKP